MTKLEYLKQLEDALKNKLGRDEINEIMRDYAEYFVEGQNQGKSDFEIARKLGEPQTVAKQIISEGLEEEQNKKKEKIKTHFKEVKQQVNESSTLKKISLVLLSCIALPFLIAGISMIFGLIAMMFGGLGSVAIGMLLLITTSIFGIAVGIASIGVLPPTAIAVILLAAIAATFFSLAILIIVFVAARGICRFIKKQWSSTKRKPITPEGYTAPVYDTSEKEDKANG